MNPFEKSFIGTTDIQVTRLGFGGLSIGNLYKSVSEEDATATVEEAYEKQIRYFDTAPLYGLGKSERTIGAVLHHRPRDTYVLSTKIGRLIVPGDSPTGPEWIFVDLPDLRPEFDCSKDAVLRSLEESRKRLRTNRIDIVYIHDPDDHYKEALNEAYPVLDDLRRQKVIGAIGAGMNQTEMLCRFAREADFDCFLLAGRYTLLDQSALDDLFPLCMDRNISIVLGGAFNSGILATGAKKEAHYNYRQAPPDIIERTRQIEKACRSHHIPLKAAALQFPPGHPVVATSIPGTSSVERLNENIQLMRHPIPQDFWNELKADRLLREDTPVPTADRRRHKNGFKPINKEE